jgi:hypothetical protein
MCTVLLPPGGYPTAVNKYITSILITISNVKFHQNLPGDRSSVSYGKSDKKELTTAFSNLMSMRLKKADIIISLSRVGCEPTF